MEHIKTIETRNLCDSAANGGCFLPVRLQDQLRHRQPGLRERKVRKTPPAMAAFFMEEIL